MKKVFYSFGVIAAMLMTACDSDNIQPEIPETGSDAGVYMKVSISLPQSRSTTDTGATDDYVSSSDGTETGQEYENKVRNVLLVLTGAEDHSFISYSLVGTLGTNGNKPTATASFSKSALKAYYGEDGLLTAEEADVHIVAYCNYTQRLKEYFMGLEYGNTDWVDYTGTIDGADSPVWAKDAFLMTNAKETPVSGFPTRFSDWDDYMTEDSPFNVSDAIKVERASARIDFKDGSPEGTAANTYDLAKVTIDGVESASLQMQLLDMALVNMSKDFYYLRRVSPDGLNTNSVLLGVETDANCVVDVDADKKLNNGAPLDRNFIESSYLFQLGKADESQEWHINKEASARWLWAGGLNNVLSGEDCNPNENGETSIKAGDYKIWRYTSENTIPSPVESQKNGITTGIVFKGQILTTDKTPEALKNVIEGKDELVNGLKKNLYLHDGKLYGGWQALRDAADADLEGGVIFTAVYGTSKDDPDGPNAKYNIWHSNPTDANWAAFREKITTKEVNITIYTPDQEDGNYYCYYYYWIRHNDNGNNGDMGNMEFSVVRNNIYKLAVTKIDRLGHPTDDGDDPDPKDPDDPDEDDNVYMSVSLHVLPWTVRVNNIEF